MSNRLLASPGERRPIKHPWDDFLDTGITSFIIIALIFVGCDLSWILTGNRSSLNPYFAGTVLGVCVAYLWDRFVNEP